MASILVTGASRGIGRATCVSLGRAGHRVFATMRDPEKAPEPSATASSESLPISVSAMDVNSDDSVRGMVGEIVAQHGPLDVLVNNAGIERRGSVEELALGEFRAVMETNYFRGAPLYAGGAPEHADQGERLHHQHYVGSRAHFGLTPGTVRGIKVRPRSDQRGTRPRGQGAGYPGSDCTTRNHRHRHGLGSVNK